MLPIILRGEVPVIPIAIYGTETITTAWRQARRANITVTITPPLVPRNDPAQSRREQRKTFTHDIMSRIATHLPPTYRGFYRHLDQGSDPATMENS